MITFQLIIFILSIVLSIALIFGFFRNLYRNRKSIKEIKKRLLALLFLVLIVIVPIQFAKYFLSDYSFYTTESEVIINTKKMDTIINLDLDKNFKDVQYFKDYIEFRTRHVNLEVNSLKDDSQSTRLINRFKEYIESEDTSYNDVGHLFMAIQLHFLKDSPYTIQWHLNQIENREIKYFEYAQGLADYSRHSWNYLESCKEHLLNSLDKEECIPETYEALARVHWFFSERDELAKLSYNESIQDFIPNSLRRSSYFINYDFIEYWGLLLSTEASQWHIAGVSAAAFLLLIWLMFMRKLDIYEPEKWRYLIMVFLISIVSMQILYPLHDFLWISAGYFRPHHPVSDLGYMVVSIGMIEEFVKILPVLIMLKFTKAINEPFDYILYPAIAALGFAFIENIGYFDEGLTRISMRGFYCCITHMAFSATIGYGLMLAKYRKYNKYLMFIVFFLIASALHGFYDFWIMDWWAIEFFWVSDLTLLLLIHLFILYINNTLNISNFYNKKIKFQLEKMKFILIALCLSILMIGYLVIAISYGKIFAQDFLISNSTRLLFYMLFLIFSFRSIRMIRGFISSITIPLWNFLPYGSREAKIKGYWIQLKPSRKFELDQEILSDLKSLNQSAQLQERIIIGESMDSYVIELSTNLNLEGFLPNKIILVPHWDEKKLNSKNRVLVNVLLIPNEEILNKVFLLMDDFTILGKMFSSHIPEPSLENLSLKQT